MQQLILAGGGHAHLGVLRALARHRPRDTEITLITPSEFSLYSGMLPGWMAGQYRLTDCRIDLRPLAQAAGVQLIVAHVGGMDAQRRCVALPDGKHLEYDLLSLNVGSESDLSFLIEAGDALLPIRPLSGFVERWPQVLQAAVRHSTFRLVVVGGGAGGVELALAARHALTRRGSSASVTLIASTDGLLPGHTPRVVEETRRTLMQRDITVHHALAVGAEEGLVLSTGELLKADSIVAATGGIPPDWLRLSRLNLDQDGYVQVNAYHQSVSHMDVFAAGDVCARIDTALAHSGVHAVRVGKVLAHNLIARLTGDTLKSYRPRKRSLYLLATGPQHAIASWGKLCGSGKWLWRLKDWIDRRFVKSFAVSAAGQFADGISNGESRAARKAIDPRIDRNRKRAT